MLRKIKIEATAKDLQQEALQIVPGDLRDSREEFAMSLFIIARLNQILKRPAYANTRKNRQRLTSKLISFIENISPLLKDFSLFPEENATQNVMAGPQFWKFIRAVSSGAWYQEFLSPFPGPLITIEKKSKSVKRKRTNIVETTYEEFLKNQILEAINNLAAITAANFPEKKSLIFELWICPALKHILPTNPDLRFGETNPNALRARHSKYQEVCIATSKVRYSKKDLLAPIKRHAHLLGWLD